MNNKKIGIIGVGNVGSTLAYTLASKNICNEIILKDIKEDILNAMSLDISQSSFSCNSKTIIKSTIKKEEFKDCDIVVITAGIPRKPGMSRDDLLFTNASIMKKIIEDTIQYNKDAIYIIVSNPLDAMVYTALKTAKISRNKIIGMAGILDSSRMSHFIFEKLNLNEKPNIKSYVMGGHGDDMVPLANISTVDGVNLNKILSKDDIKDIEEKTKNGGAQIVKLLGNGSAYYAPAYSTYLMIESILKDKKEQFPCAIQLNGEYGYEDVVAGVNITLGKNGIEEILNIKLNNIQKEQFQKSVSSVKELIEKLKNNNIF